MEWNRIENIRVQSPSKDNYCFENLQFMVCMYMYVYMGLQWKVYFFLWLWSKNLRATGLHFFATE